MLESLSAYWRGPQQANDDLVLMIHKHITEAEKVRLSGNDKVAGLTKRLADNALTATPEEKEAWRKERAKTLDEIEEAQFVLAALEQKLAEAEAAEEDREIRATLAPISEMFARTEGLRSEILVEAVALAEKMKTHTILCHQIEELNNFARSRNRADLTKPASFEFKGAIVDLIIAGNGHRLWPVNYTF